MSDTIIVEVHQTDNLGLDLLNSHDGTYNSNLEIIDTEVGNAKTRVGDLEAHFPAIGQFVAGTGSATKNYAVAVGRGTTASGDYAVAVGESTTASGTHAFASGYQSTASGKYSHAESSLNTASGQSSHAEGSNTTASSFQSHAEGGGTKATSSNAHAEGNNTEANRNAAHAEGQGTMASGEAAHAEGIDTVASGYASHAEGYDTHATHARTHAEGRGVYAVGDSQHAFGAFNVYEQNVGANSKSTHIEVVGNGTSDTARSNARTLDWSGNEEIAGDLTINKGKTGEKKIGTELTKKVNRSSVTAVKTAYSEDGTVTVDDALDEPAKLTLTLEPKQDLHGYDKPWVGGAGKNLLPINTTSRTISGVDITVNKDSNGNNVSVTFNGTATGEVFFYITGVTSGIPDSMLGKRIILSGGKDGVIIRAWHYDGTNIATSADGNASFAFTCEQGVIDCRVPSGTTVNTTIYPMARLATEADASYEPYSNICPITGFDTVNVMRTGYELSQPFVTPLPISASSGSTVYSGTVTVNEDGSGTVVADRAMSVFDGDENWLPAEDPRVQYLPVSMAFPGANRGAYEKVVCSHLEMRSSVRSSELHVGQACYNGNASNWLINMGFTSEADLKTYLSTSPMTAAYPLTTPQSYPLTASQIQTLLGTNHIWTDSGCEFTLDYRTDKYGKLDEVYSAFPEGSVGPDDVVTITDGADGIPVKSLSVAIEPKQDLHGHTHPWVGGAGKNLGQLSPVTEGSGQFTTKAYANEGVKVSNPTAQYARQGYLFNVPNGTYTVSYYAKGNGYNRIYYGKNDGAWSSTATGWVGNVTVTDTRAKYTYTITTDTGSIFFGLYINTTPLDTSSYIEVDTFQIESGSDATEWEPYSNICPISGWDAVNVTRTGKNLITEIIKGYFPADTGILMASNLWEADIARVSAGKTYSFIPDSQMPNGGVYAFYIEKPKANSVSYNGTRTIDSSRRTFVAPINGYVGIRRSNGEEGAMIYEGSTATPYEPPYFTTLPISLSKAGTVYGGTLDVGTGVMMVEKVCYKVSDFTQIAYDNTNGWFYVNKSKFPNNQDPLAPASASVIGDGLISSFAEAVSRNSLPNMSVAVCVGTNQALLIKTGHTTVADLVSAYGNETVVYTLATPITYQLSPRELTTLLGTNNVWSDAGQVTVEYRADPKLYIAKHGMSAEDRQDITDIKAHFPATGRLVTGICTASADYAAAVGNSTTASGFGATAQGSHTLASGMCSHAEGSDTQAIAGDSHAEGKSTVASGSNSHAEGKSSQASKIASHAEGNSTAASGNYSHAEGSGTVASGSGSHAEGYSTTASKDYAHAEGCETTASGSYAHAEGLGTVANHASQHVFGEYNVVDDSSAAATSRGNFAEIVGNGANSHKLSNARTLDWSGNERLAGGLTLGMGTADEVTITPAQLKALLALLS